MRKAGQERVLSVGNFPKFQGKFPSFELSCLGWGEMGSSHLRTVLQKQWINECESTESGQRIDNKNIQKRSEKIWAELSKTTVLNLCKCLCFSYFKDSLFPPTLTCEKVDNNLVIWGCLLIWELRIIAPS